MGRNMRAGKKPKKPGAGDMRQQLAQVQAMQRQMEEMQAELAEKEITTSSGGGAVEVTINGDKKITNIKLDPEIVDADDVEMLQDLILTAVNEAIRQIDEISEREMSNITGGLGLPPGLF
ncbi:MAG: YbaB/EbfC family nucleoid-associated protein [Eubacteriales bacterium]|nr:YbaB/EbfC family nucleoid-associated protein [Eubacteriales bacterium]MDY3332177.1 YbaB/EbfC family nucleoid-associated protein [Gallibacter sp.]